MKKILLVFVFSFCGLSLFAQLTANTAVTANQMVQTLVGQGFTFSNAVLNCPAAARGIFGGGSVTNLGLDSGIVLTTGTASLLGNPQTTQNSTNNGLIGGDTWLIDYGVTTGNLFDQCILEFDVIPICDTLRFQYVFASEEYPEFTTTGTIYKDAFAFFINGPGIPLGTNIATVPGNIDPINITTINNGSANCPGGPTGPCVNCLYYVNNCNGTSVVYDGFTTILTAETIVQACSTYHVKLVIGDGGDGGWDSGVFLKKGSLNCFGVAITASTTGSSGVDAVEACQDGIFQMCLSQAQAAPFVFYYTIGGTATPIDDYVSFPDSVVFPADSQCVYVTVTPVIDGINEGAETLMIYYNPSLCAGLDSSYINILDLYTIDAGPNVSFCNGDTAQVGQPIFVPGTTYSWTPPLSGLSNDTVNYPTVYLTNTNDTLPYIFVYYLTTSISGCSNWDSVIVTVKPTPVPDAGSDISICSGQSGVLGGSPKLNYNYQWSPPTGIGSPTSSFTSITLSNPGATAVVVTDTLIATVAGCVGKDYVNITVLPSPSADAGSDKSLCSGETILIGSAPVPVYNYTWSPATGLGAVNSSSTSLTLTNTGTTPIIFSYILNAGWTSCSDYDTMTVTVNPLPLSEAGSDITVCPGESGQIGSSSTSGYTYAWSPTTGLSPSTSANPSVSLPNILSDPFTQTYNVTTSLSGCDTYDLVHVLVRGTPVSVIKITPDTICLDKEGTAVYTGTTLQSPDYNWMFGEPASKNGVGSGPFALTWGTAGKKTISLIVSEYGCPSVADSASFVVIDCSVDPTNVMTPNGDGSNDAFHIVNIERNPNSYLAIFNRWGKIIFETPAYLNDWTGGKEAAGVYYYVLRLEDGTEKHGMVTLVK